MRDASSSPEMECLNFEEFYSSSRLDEDVTCVSMADRSMVVDDDNLTSLYGVQHMQGSADAIAADFLSDSSGQFAVTHPAMPPMTSPPRRSPPPVPLGGSFFIESSVGEGEGGDDAGVGAVGRDNDTTYESYMNHLNDEPTVSAASLDMSHPGDVSLGSVQTAAPQPPAVSLPHHPSGMFEAGPPPALEHLQYSSEIQRLHLVIEDMREHHEREMRSVRRSLRQQQQHQHQQQQQQDFQDFQEPPVVVSRQPVPVVPVVPPPQELPQPPPMAPVSVSVSPRSQRRTRSPSHHIRVSSLEAENAALHAEVAALQQSLASERERVGERDDDLDAVEAELQEAKAAADALRKEVAALQAEKQAVPSPSRPNRATGLDPIDKEAIQSSKEYRELKHALSEVSNERATLVGDMGRLRQQLQQVEAEKADLLAEVRARDDAVVKAEKVEATLHEECNRLRNEFRSLQEKLRRTDSVVAALSSEKQGAEDLVKSVRLHLRERDAEVDKMGQESQSLKQAIATLEGTKAKLEHSYNTLQHESAGTQRQRASMQKKLEEAQALHVDLDRKYQNSQLEISQLQHTINALRSERTEKVQQQQHQQQQHQQLQLQLQQQQQQHQQQQQQLRQSMPQQHHAFEAEAHPSEPEAYARQGMTRREVREAEQQARAADLQAMQAAPPGDDPWAPTNSEVRVLKKLLHRYGDDPAGPPQQQQQQQHYHHHHRPPSPAMRTPVALRHPEPLMLDDDPPQQHHRHYDVPPPQPFAQPSAFQRQQGTDHASPGLGSAYVAPAHGGISKGSLGGGFGLSALAGMPAGGRAKPALRAQPLPVAAAVTQEEGSVQRRVDPAEAQERIQWLEDTLVALQHTRSKKDDELAKLQQTKAKSIADRKNRMKIEQDMQALEKDINVHKRELRQLMQPHR